MAQTRHVSSTWGRHTTAHHAPVWKHVHTCHGMREPREHADVYVHVHALFSVPVVMVRR